VSSGNGRTALVTGGAGFIGGHIVERLIDEGWVVRVLDDFSTGREENLESNLERIELLRGDICDPEILERAVDGMDVVFHQAAIASVPRSVAEPIRTHEINSSGTLRVLECARQAGVRRVVFAASSAAYGNSKALPKSEGMTPEPLSPYALQKIVGEQYCYLYTALYGLETVALRYFNVFGPRQDPKSEYAAVIPKFICAALAEERPTIYGDGGQTRDFVFVGDVADAVFQAATSETCGGFNAGTASEIRVLELADTIVRITGGVGEHDFQPPRKGDARASFADIASIRQALGWKPAHPLEAGLTATLAWYREKLGIR